MMVIKNLLNIQKNIICIDKIIVDVNLVKDKPIPIKKGTTKNITKQSNVGRTNTGKYFFIGLFSVFISSPIISQRGFFTSTLTLKHIHNEKRAVIKRVCTANIQIKHRVLFFCNMGGFLLRKKQAFQGFAIATAASLASLSPVAAYGALTILATV